MGKQLAIEHPAEADIIVPVPDSGVAAAIGYARAVGHQLPAGDYPQSLRRANVYRAFAEHSLVRRAVKTQSDSGFDQGQARRSG